MKTLIVDDEPMAQEILENFVGKIPFLEFIQRCDSVVEALPVTQDVRPDLIILDIRMPEMSGVDLLRVLRQQAPQVIFTTAYPEFALEGLESLAGQPTSGLWNTCSMKNILHVIMHQTHV